MKAIFILFLSIILILAGIGCGESGASISQEEAGLALGITIAAYMYNSFAMGFGQEVTGIEFDKDKNAMTFKDYSFNEIQEKMDNDIGYTSMSGTIIQSEGQSINADLSLQGSKVKTIQYELPKELFEGEPPESFTITVNGRPMQIKPSEMADIM